MICIFLASGLEEVVKFTGLQEALVTPLDFFLCGYVNDVVFETPAIDIEPLTTRTREVIATV